MYRMTFSLTFDIIGALNMSLLLRKGDGRFEVRGRENSGKQEVKSRSLSVLNVVLSTRPHRPYHMEINVIK